jgi:hypothetical protein
MACTCSAVDTFAGSGVLAFSQDLGESAGMRIFGTLLLGILIIAFEIAVFQAGRLTASGARDPKPNQTENKQSDEEKEKNEDENTPICGSVPGRA